MVTKLRKYERQLGCVSQDVELPEYAAISRKSPRSFGTNSTSTIHKSCAASRKHPRKQRSIAWCVTSAVHTLQNLRIGLRQRPKDKSDAPAETRGEWPKDPKAQRKEQSCLPMSGCCRPHPQKSQRKGEFVVDAGASMHMVSRKDLNSPALETVYVSQSPTTVVAANREVLTKGEATLYVRELDLFVTVMLVEDTQAVLSLGKLCEDQGYNNHWTSGQKPHLINNGRKIDCNTANYVPFVVLGIDKFFKLIFNYFSCIFITGNRDSHGASSINKK